MESFRTDGLFCFVFILILNGISSFNLEPKLPIIKQGEKGSYFGFSVAEHQILDPDTGKITDQVLLVGAPRAQTEQPGTNRSGAVYRCKLSTHRKDCQQLQIDQDSMPPTPDVMKDDQWMGVTVKSQGPGGYVLACAHRYVLKGDDYQWGQGICYSLTPFLDLHRAWEPCLNRPVNKAHEQFGFCQAGTSADISEDYNIILGTPGPFTWRGTLFVNSIRFRIRDDKTWYMSPLLDNYAPVDKYSYLGMSVTSGRFFKDEISYVGGAPRAGEVLFFKKQRGDSNFRVQAVLKAEQFASAFGYSLASLDVNNDGFLDIVVGAPFYFEKGIGGAAYIYLNSKQALSSETRPIKLTGKSESRFGFSLASIGDINKDGYADLAIGAPYEGKGAVYIFLGSADGIIVEPSQVIHSEDFPKEVLSKTPIASFGYSLSGGMDLDNNGYPDLMVGAYESDAIVLLRSRPVLDIVTSVKGKLTHIDPEAKGCEDDPSAPFVCFSFQACFQFNSSSFSHTTSAKLKYRIEADPGRKYYRIKFKSSLNTNTPHIVEKELIVLSRSIGENHCSKEIVYLKDKSDIQNSIKFKLSYSLVQKEPQMPREGEQLPDINRYPILDQQEASKVFEAKFLKDCGINDICESELNLKAELNLPKEEKDIPTLFLGEKFINMSVTIINRGEPAYDTSLYISHTPSVSFVGRKVLKGDSIECSPINTSILQCDLGNPFKRGLIELNIKFNARGISDHEKEIKFGVKVNTTSLEQTQDDDFIILTADVAKVAELELRGVSKPDHVFYGGNGDGMGSEQHGGSLIFHTYELINNGPWKASDVKIKFSWPIEIANRRDSGKMLLYMVDVPQVTGNTYCEVDPKYINPHKNLPQYKTARAKREMVVMPEKMRMDGRNYQVVTLDCDRDTAKCYHFNCYVKNLLAEHSAVVRIKARIWNSTFVEDYPHVDWVRVISRAKIELDESIKQKTDNDRASAETKAYPDASLYQREQSVPLWIILLATGCGLLLLVILILILWRLGFFKRKKPGYIPADTDEKPINNY